MSKLARQIIITIIAGIIAFVLSKGLDFCITVDGEITKITNKVGFCVCLIFMCILAVVLIIGTILIWTKKNVPDITIGKRD